MALNVKLIASLKSLPKAGLPGWGTPEIQPSYAYLAKSAGEQETGND